MFHTFPHLKEASTAYSRIGAFVHAECLSDGSEGGDSGVEFECSNHSPNGQSTVVSVVAGVVIEEVFNN